MSATPAAALDIAAAREVLLLQAYESGERGDDPMWSADDRAWATRLAREDVPPPRDAARFLHRRAQHALQRLAPRDAGVRRVLQGGGLSLRAGLFAALLLGGLCGLLVDTIGGGQRINLLAPPVWAVLVWNVLIYAALAVGAVWPRRGPGWIKSSLARRMSGPWTPQGSALARFRSAWAVLTAPLQTARAALLLHAAAAALACGLIAGLYVRGLVLDYRAGWQSTFLSASQAHAALSLMLAPARAVTGIPLPDADALQALRVGAAPVAATALDSAAPWIHLYAAMLALFVVLPRAALAAGSAWRVRTLSHHLPLPLDLPYFQRLLREAGDSAAVVQLLPLGEAPQPHATTCLRGLLAAVLGDGVQLSCAPATAYGHEHEVAALAPPPGATLRLVLADLASTPEDDRHGAFVRALREALPALPPRLLVDEAAFRARFAAMPSRIHERRAAWQAWARREGVVLASVDLSSPAVDDAELRAALTA